MFLCCSEYSLVCPHSLEGPSALFPAPSVCLSNLSGLPPRPPFLSCRSGIFASTCPNAAKPPTVLSQHRLVLYRRRLPLPLQASLYSLLLSPGQSINAKKNRKLKKKKKSWISNCAAVFSLRAALSRPPVFLPPTPPRVLGVLSALALALSLSPLIFPFPHCVCVSWARLYHAQRQWGGILQ